MIAESTISTARRSIQKSSAKAPMFVPAAPAYAQPVETPGISTEKLLWLGKYLRVKKETSDTWILSEMGWLMENTINFLADITSKAFDRLLGTVATNIVPVTIVRTPLLSLDSVQSKLTANSVSIEVECNYEHTLTGTRYDIDRALHLLLYAAPRLCDQDNARQKFTLLDYWNTSLLQISHPVTEVPPEMFDYLFNCNTGMSSYRSPETLTQLKLSVQKCTVTYNLDADSRDKFIVLTIVSRIGLMAMDKVVPGTSFLPLTASFQCVLHE